MLAQDTASIFPRAADLPRLGSSKQGEASSPPAAAGEEIPRRIRSAKAHRSAAHRLKSLHTREDIDAIIHRECARCERNGHQFSVVLITAGNTGVARHHLRLARMLSHRARGTDEIGWFTPTQLCAVLPDTAVEGAMVFLKQYSAAAHFRGLSPVAKIMVYPGGSEAGDQLSEKTDGSRKDAGKSGVITLHTAADLTPLLIKPMPTWKRAIDLCVGISAMVVALPMLAGAALVIKLSDPGPILFKQKRAGLGGKPFTIYKLRTMVVDAETRKHKLRDKSEQDGPAFKIKHDPRITRIGRILRETSLDELPQLLNVLKGDMSLVGPRPLPLDEADQCDTWHRRRLDVTPGLTCTWQVMGRSKVSFAEWIRMDRTYIGRRSLWQDLKLMFLTVPSVLMRRGAK